MLLHYMQLQLPKLVMRYNCHHFRYIIGKLWLFLNILNMLPKMQCTQLLL